MAISSAAISEVSISDVPEEVLVPVESLLLPENLPVMIIGNNFFRADMGVDFAGVDFLALVERIGWTVSGAHRDGSLILDPSKVKILREAWPVIRGTSGNVLNFYFGAQLRSPENSIAWQGPFPFVIGEDASIRPLVEGAYLAMRVEGLGVDPWSLLSIDLDIDVTGEIYDQ